MGNNVKFQGFSFYVDIPVEYTGKPTSKNVVNHFDLISDIVSLKRLDGETNVDFKQRTMDVAIHPDGGTYDGVINGITRALGYAREHAITITLKLDSAGDPLARNPRVEILANKVILYHDYRADGTQNIDDTIRTFKPEDTGYFLDDLITEINTSVYFSATIIAGMRANMHSTNLLQENSDVYVQGDLIRSDSISYLSQQYLVEDSLVFDEDKPFRTEVLVTPASDGEYKIDRINGRIYVYTIPQGNLGVSYHAANFPFKVDYSPVKIYTLQDDDFQYELFKHETLDSGDETNTLPNQEGSEIFHQLFKETEVFWGE